MKIVKRIQLKIVTFTAVKYCSILHGRVFVISLVVDVLVPGNTWAWAAVPPVGSVWNPDTT